MSDNCHQQPVYDVYADCPTLQVAFTDGDRLPELVGVLRDVDLTGFTIKMNITRPSGVPITKTAIILDAAQGQFKFTWGSDDLEHGFGQPAVIRAIDSSGKSETIAQFKIDVKKDPEA